MADSVFAGTIVLIENGYVLVGDGKVQAVGLAQRRQARQTAARACWCCRARSTPRRTAAVGSDRDFVRSTRSAVAGSVIRIVDMHYDDKVRRHRAITALSRRPSQLPANVEVQIETHDLAMRRARRR
jgi:hypothetical protein